MEDLEKEIAVAERKTESMLKEMEKIEGTKEFEKKFREIGVLESLEKAEKLGVKLGLRSPEAIQKICIDEETFKEIKTIAENYESEGGDLSQYPKASKLLKD